MSFGVYRRRYYLRKWRHSRFFIIATPSPVLIQDKFRVRSDDGTETTANWLAAEDINLPLGVDVNYRLRFNIRETAGLSTSPNFRLQYNKNSGVWNNVTAASSNVRISTSPNVTDGTSTTEQLAGAGTFTAGFFDDASGLSGIIALNNQDTEVEYCIQLRAVDLVDTDSIEFRLVDGANGDKSLTTYTVTPTITVSELSTPTQLSHTEFPKQNSYVGPFDDGTNQRVFMVDQGTNYIVCMKVATGSSPADTDWAIGDSSFVGGIESIWCTRNSTTIRISVGNVQGRYSYFEYDETTDTFTTDNEHIIIAGDDALYDAIPSLVACSLVYRPTGSDKVVAIRTNDNSSEKILALEKVGAGSWTVLTNSQVFNGGIIAGHENATSTAYFYLHNTAGTSLRRAFQTDGATSLSININADSTIDTAGVAVNGGFSGSGTDSECIYIDSDNTLSQLVSSASVTTGVSDNTVYGNGRSTEPFLAACMADNGTDRYVVYADDSTQDIFLAKDTGSGWGTDIEVVNSVTCNRLSTKINNAATHINIVYEDVSTVKFASVSLTQTFLPQIVIM